MKTPTGREKPSRFLLCPSGVILIPQKERRTSCSSPRGERAMTFRRMERQDILRPTSRIPLADGESISVPPSDTAICSIPLASGKGLLSEEHVKSIRARMNSSFLACVGSRGRVTSECITYASVLRDHQPKNPADTIFSLSARDGPMLARIECCATRYRKSSEHNPPWHATPTSVLDSFLRR